MNVMLLEFVSTPSIYNDCSTRKTLWEENFTLGEFTLVNTKHFGHHNVRRNIDIKDSDKYITLEISLKFGSMENMRIKYSHPKDHLGRSRKGLITSMGINTNIISKKCRKSRYDITNVSIKYLSKIIKKFEKLPYNGYVRKRTKKEPTNSYFYIAIHIAKSMMRTDTLNSHIDLVRTEMDGTQHITISHICYKEEREPNEFLAVANLFQVCSTDEGESPSVITDEISME